MKLIAKELGVKFERMDATSFMNDVKSHRLFNETFVRIANEGEPVVIGIDEIHALPVKLQTGLLTLLQDRVYSYVTPSGTKNVPMPEFTFIGATTDYNSILSTVKDRCSNLTFVLEDYKRNELRQIFNNKFAAMGLSVDDDAIIDQCINRCRSSIREVNAIISGLNTKAVNRNNGVITMDMVKEYFTDRGVDSIGLNKTEVKILEVIRDEPTGNVSEETLAARLYLDSGLLTSEYEPYLIKLGFITISSKGRSLTQKADDYLRYGYYVFDDGYVVGSKPSADGEIQLSTPGAPSASSTDAEAPAAEPTDASSSAEAPVAEPVEASASAEAPAAETAAPFEIPPAPVETADAPASGETPAEEPVEAELVVPSFSTEAPTPNDGEGASDK
jgi:Holliday junction DNA helicase RuvB